MYYPLPQSGVSKKTQFLQWPWSCLIMYSLLANAYLRYLSQYGALQLIIWIYLCYCSMGTLQCIGAKSVTLPILKLPCDYKCSIIKALLSSLTVSIVIVTNLMSVFAIMDHHQIDLSRQPLEFSTTVILFN